MLQLNLFMIWMPFFVIILSSDSPLKIMRGRPHKEKMARQIEVSLNHELNDYHGMAQLQTPKCLISVHQGMRLYYDYPIANGDLSDYYPRYVRVLGCRQTHSILEKTHRQGFLLYLPRYTIMICDCSPSKSMKWGRLAGHRIRFKKKRQVHKNKG